MLFKTTTLYKRLLKQKNFKQFFNNVKLLYKFFKLQNGDLKRDQLHHMIDSMNDTFLFLNSNQWVGKLYGLKCLQ